MKKNFKALTVFLLVLCMVLSNSLTVFANICMYGDSVNNQQAAYLFVEELQSFSGEDLDEAEQLSDEINPKKATLKDWCEIIEAAANEMDADNMTKATIIVDAANEAIDTLVNQAQEQSEFIRNDKKLAKSLEKVCNTYASAATKVCKKLGVTVKCEYDTIAIGTAFAKIDPLYIRR